MKHCYLFFLFFCVLPAPAQQELTSLAEYSGSTITGLWSDPSPLSSDQHSGVALANVKKIPPIPSLSEKEKKTSLRLEIAYDQIDLELEVLSGDYLQEVMVYDLSGKKLIHKKIYENSHYLNLPTGSLQEAVHIVRVKTRNSDFVDKEVLLLK